MASITVMKNFIIKKAQGTSDDKLKTIVKILKNYNKLDSDSKKKIQPAIEKLYSKYQEKDSSSKETKKVGSKVSKKKFKTQELKDVISKFKAKIGQKLWKEATSGTTIKQDAERPAKPKGKRYVSKKGYTTNQYGRYKNQVGTPYWETRANRFDVKQPAKTFPKLAKGGMVEHALKKGDKIVDSFQNVVIVENEGKTFVVNLNVGKRYSENQWFSMNHGTNSKNSKE